MKLWSIFGLSLGMSLAVQAQAVTVATSFSILEDMVKNVGGDEVKVVNFVGPDMDIHSYEIKPSDAKLLSKDVKVLFTNGLELDNWANRLAKSSNFKGKIVAVSDGIQKQKLSEEVLGEEDHDHEHEGHDHEAHDHEHEGHDHGAHDHEHEGHGHEAHDHEHEGHDHEHEGHDHAAEGHHDHHHGEFDPHAWQSLNNAQVYVDNIAKALSEVDTKNAATYAKNAAAYKQKLQALDSDLKKQFAALPENRRYLVTTHDALGYFARDYQLKVLTPLGFTTTAEPSAKDVATVIKAIRDAKLPAVFLENVQNRKLVDQLANESGAKIGGTLYTDALAAEGLGSTYLGMIESNAKTILEALK
ncbi:metal ABC transporter solute-binding protein, Zn/Mn family [Pelistega europaea]|uniref:Zinc ABC transporter solute-binding protein n=1 Tax=Pelistega europaea TaxID=106147 RepID=A0A7Y4LBD2_9BURK|nr:zinc ABC transporter substrate-binding protein [Pelistega europaea]NOL49327.1 zinc ABC transporter solute-binding protein [Pelistega europaea]